MLNNFHSNLVTFPPMSSWQKNSVTKNLLCGQISKPSYVASNHKIVSVVPITAYPGFIASLGTGPASFGGDDMMVMCYIGDIVGAGYDPLDQPSALIIYKEN